MARLVVDFIIWCLITLLISLKLPANEALNLISPEMNSGNLV